MSIKKIGRGRRIVAAASAAVALVALAGCASGSGGAPDASGGASRPLTVGYSAVAPFVLPALMAEAGTEEFSSRDLSFTGQLISAPDALPLLATGKLDVWAGPVSAGVFNAIAADSDLRIVAPSGTNSIDSDWYISKAALGDEPYSLDAWKGKTVYTSTGTGSYVMISLAHELEPAGIALTDLNFAQIPPDDVGPALSSGALFAGIPASVKVRQELLDKGEIFAGPSAVWPVGISPAFIFFGASLLDDPDLAQKVLEAFAEVEGTTLQGDYVHDPETAAMIAEILDYKPEDVPTFVTYSYPTDLSFPEGWTQNAEDVWRSIPDVLSYEGSVADKVVDQELIDRTLAAMD